MPTDKQHEVLEDRHLMFLDVVLYHPYDLENWADEIQIIMDELATALIDLKKAQGILKD